MRWLLTSIRTLLIVAIISSVVLLLVFSGQPQQGVLSVKALGLTHEGVPTSQLGEGLSRSIRLMAWGSLRVPAIDLGKVKEVVVNVGGSVIGEGPDYVDVSLPVIIYREEGGWPRANVFIRVFRNGSVIAWLSKGELWEWGLVYCARSELLGKTTSLACALELLFYKAYGLGRETVTKLLKSLKYYSPEYPEATHVLILSKNCFDCELWARYRVNENAKPYVLAVLKAYGVGGDDIIEIDGDRLDPIYACTPPCKYLEVGVHRIKCIGRGTIESIIVIVYGEK